MLTERAKKLEPYIYDLDIGESCYLLALVSAIELFRMKCIESDELYKKQKDLENMLLKYYQHREIDDIQQKDLENMLLKYYQHREIDDIHIRIANRYSPVMTDAEKTGCPICQKLVRIFDGREK